MTLNSFIEKFNLIKPTLQEIRKLDSSLPDNATSELYKEYDLRIVSNGVHKELILDLIFNTNISDLYFSSIYFKKPELNDIVFEIGSVLEKGVLLFDKFDKQVKFKYQDNICFIDEIEAIDEAEFIKFFLIFCELDFNRTFRRNSIASVTDDLVLHHSKIAEFSIIEVLFNEIGFTVKGFLK